MPAQMPFEPDEVPYALPQIARLQEGVKAEFDLISGRMSWLVVSESFIFSAFATAVANYRPDHSLRGPLLFLIMVMPLVGILMSASVYLAILAGHQAMATLKDQRERMVAALPPRLLIDLISTHSPEQRWGNLPTHVIPPVLLVVWTVAFVLLIT